MPEGQKDNPEERPNQPAIAHQAIANRVSLGALCLDSVTIDEAVSWTLNYIARHRGEPPARICSPNAAIVALANEDAAFAEIVRAMELVVADGMPLLWAASLLGTPLQEQIRGVELMEAVCAKGAPAGLSVYILGGLAGAAELAAEQLSTRYPGLRVAGTDCPPIGFENDANLNGQVRKRVIATAPDFLIVALGSPKQERWIFENYRDLPVGVIQGVGAAVDTIAGLRSRPPVWMRNAGLEWLGRLVNEPVRLWSRYALGNTRFVWIIMCQWWRRIGRINPRH